MRDFRRIISLIVYVVDRCCDVCATQLTQMLVCARNVSLCFVTSSFVRSELRQGRHILADVLGLQAIVQNKGTL